MITENVQAVVLMGGLGTRLKEYTDDCPKSLVKVNGKPFFEYSLELLIKAGFKKFLFLVGYRAEMIEDYFGDGSRFGISIKYCYDGKELLGTGGALRRAYDYLEDDFLLLYGDSFMDINYEETVFRYFEGKLHGKRALMTVFYNKDMFDKSNVIVKDGEIVLYDKVNRSPEMHYIDYGVCMYEKSLFASYEEGVKFDVGNIQHELSLSGEIAAHEVTKRFYEIGSPESLKEFSEYIKARIDEKRPAVFLDRDGVINELVYNEDAEQIDSPMNKSQFVLMDGVIDAIREIKSKGYYVFLVTNQPSAAKGKASLKNLYDINTMLVKLCMENGVEIDDVQMCPHYPKKTGLNFFSVNYSADNDISDAQKELLKSRQRVRELTERFFVKTCDCRKPKSGMIKNITDKYNIDIENSYMVGDSHTDIKCGISAGCKTIFLGDYKCYSCRELCDSKPDHICKNLKAAAELIQMQPE